MMRRVLAGIVVGLMTVLTPFYAGLAGPQDKAKNEPPPGEKSEPPKKREVPRRVLTARERAAEISKLLAEYDLKPAPPSAIPDDPPPHEGAMISIPYHVEPPDLVIVEVLDALPGRPISGERMVRPDGKIDLGFYGEVYVRGMTMEQVKVAILKQLRNYLSDAALGLEVVAGSEPVFIERPAVPPLPEGVPSPFGRDEEPKDNIKPRSTSQKVPSSRRVVKPRTAAAFGSAGGHIPVRPVRSARTRPEGQDQQPPAAAAGPVKLFADGQGKVTITIDLNGQGPNLAGKAAPMPAPAPEEPGDDDTEMVVVAPVQSPHVFVDVTAYNSKNYYLLGDVRITGKLPYTGNETVLDALQYAGGLMPSAEPKDIRLVRTGRGGKPAKVYHIDLAAIEDQGDVTKNYQIFPGDRLIVGRLEVVKKTVEIDRLNAPIQSIVSYMLQEGTMLRSLQFATGDHRDELLKEMVEFWAKELARPGGIRFDEQTLREALLRKMKLTPPPLQAGPATR